MQSMSRLLAGAARLVALAALAASVLPASPAAAAPDVIRYASVKACERKGGAKEPCGVWRLTMRGGGTIELPDARVTPRDARGKERKGQAAPFAVSGDGRSVAYFRKSDGRLVVRRLGGPVTVVRGGPPGGVGMDDVALYLSRTGDRIAVEAVETADERPTIVYDLSEEDPADPRQLPGRLVFHGFGGESALAAELSGERVARLISYSPDGRRDLGIPAPAVVADNAPYGLDPEGTKVAFLSDSDDKVTLRLFDVRSGVLTRGIPVRLDDADLPEAVSWAGDDQVVAHVARVGKGGRSTMRVLQINVRTGAAVVRETYRVRKDAFTYAVRGA